MTWDNSVVVACEGAFALLEHEGCLNLEKLAAPDYQLPGQSRLEASMVKAQSVKIAYLRRFWESVGRRVVRDATQKRLEEVVSFHLVFS